VPAASVNLPEVRALVGAVTKSCIPTLEPRGTGGSVMRSGKVVGNRWRGPLRR